jgi:tRNA pseudouridine55 synthase
VSAGGASTVRHGILPVDKPSGPTSHDIVAQARRHFHTRSVGHAGTLDPMASGVLVLLFGEATKLSNVITLGDKRYRATVAFGRATDSHDAEGKPVQESELPANWLDEPRLHAALRAEAERQQQVPPNVSAVKVAGKRAYRLHHKGIAPVLAPRPVAVRELSLCSWSQTQLTLELNVSKGYYVRALARDLGAALGVPAHLSELRRLASGGFHVNDACAWPPTCALAPIPLQQALRGVLPLVRLTHSGVLRARQGRVLCREDFLDDPERPLICEPLAETPIVAWTDPDGLPIALGEFSDGKFLVRRGFSAGLAELREQAAPYAQEPANAQDIDT